MGKALVIKNADFSTNKVATITFVDIACNGITLSEDTLTIEGRETVTLEYTVTPSNTTDPVQWSSSDDTIISVNNGILTIEGIGECTVTARCGKYKAVCAVTVDLEEAPYLALGSIYGMNSGTSDYAVGISPTSSNRLCCVALVGEQSFNTAMTRVGTNPILPMDSDTRVTAIRIPNHAAYIHVHAEKVYRSSPGFVLYFVDGNTRVEDTRNSGRFGLKHIKSVSITPPNTLIVDQYVEVPEGATGYIADIRVTPSSIIEDDVSTYEDLENQFADPVKGSFHYLKELPEGATAYVQPTT